MGFAALFFIAVGLSMDAFAVAACAGLTMRTVTIRKLLIVGSYFGIFQGLMPFAGFLLATRFADDIVAFDHWIAFALLGLIGGKMILESSRQEGCRDRACPADACPDRACPGGKRPHTEEAALTPSAMLPLALATSIDALAVGVSFAFLQVAIAPAVVLIGVTTFALSMAGVRIGHVFGTRFKSKAELAGGVILILIGTKILLEHLSIWV